MNSFLCSTCQLYRDGCPVHPQGILGDNCPDHRLKYESDFTPQLTRSQQWEILNTHPFFTGKCSQCNHVYNQPSEPNSISWSCPVCNWQPQT